MTEKNAPISPPPYACRVYYEDTDAGGVVYYANYLRFAERARSEWLRAVVNPESGKLWDGKGLFFVMRHCDVDYLASARLEDVLSVETNLVHLGGASMGMEQIIRRDGTVLNRMKITLVCVDAEGKVLRIPPEWRQKLSPYLKAKEGA